MNFDEIIDRRNTHSSKWDTMEQLYGISQDDGIAMWVADTDFRPPACVQNAVEKMHGHGIYGYYGDDRSYYEAICWWMKTRHNWEDGSSLDFFNPRPGQRYGNVRRLLHATREMASF